MYTFNNENLGSRVGSTIIYFKKSKNIFMNFANIIIKCPVFDKDTPPFLWLMTEKWRFFFATNLIIV